jgi:hypothetical protein
MIMMSLDPYLERRWRKVNEDDEDSLTNKWNIRLRLINYDNRFRN